MLAFESLLVFDLNEYFSLQCWVSSRCSINHNLRHFISEFTKHTALNTVSTKELEALIETPSSVNQLNTTPSFSTYLWSTMNYFLVGSAFSEKSGPLSGVLFGLENVNTATLENGSFGILQPADARRIHLALEDLDASDFADRILVLEECLADDEELFEFEVMPREEIASEILEDLDRLRNFYRQCSDSDKGVVSYTT